MKRTQPASPLMSGRTLTFDAADVRRVVEHALGATAWRPLVLGYDEDMNAITEPGRPAVLFVHDDGCYLMSNAQPGDIIDGRTRHFVAYAHGCHPERDADWYDTARDLVGGDDFCETLPWAELILASLNAGADRVALRVNGHSVEFAELTTAASVRGKGR